MRKNGSKLDLSNEQGQRARPVGDQSATAGKQPAKTGDPEGEQGIWMNLERLLVGSGERAIGIV